MVVVYKGAWLENASLRDAICFLRQSAFTRDGYSGRGIEEKMDNLSKFYTNVKNSITFPIKKDIDDYACGLTKDPKVFGNSVWPLIFFRATSPAILEEIKDYFDEKIIQSRLDYDTDDYHLHLAFIYFTQKNYSGCLVELEKITTGILHQQISKWATFSGYLTRAETLFPSKNLTSKTGSLSLNHTDANVILLYKWGYTYQFLDDLPLSDTAYHECLNIIQFTAKNFEKELSQLCVRKGVPTGMISQMIQNLQPNYSGMGSVENDMNNSVGGARNIDSASGFMANLTTLKNTVVGYGSDDNKKYGGILFLCRHIRNKCSHESTLTTKFFNNRDEFTELMSILHEGLLLVSQVM
ncbi:hypothetical protein [Fibrobacter sp. UWB11]|uniref:hypothetical protein n=1 Tax=Fibrobacter sp. UWB11 TaxID=1896202 RepID=UPI0009280217|nr:hypothetical protein [Fibrobacter sp. UWB11]SIO16651.1 hypothetical protein SAMN05720758_1748 [Fibrobacter sp. UWB11]